MRLRSTPLTAAAFLSLLSLFAFLRASADQVYTWSGNDPRFTGSFAISDEDFAAREFRSPTAVRFAFNDPENPEHNIVLEDVRGAYPDNFQGRLTADRESLSHEPNSWNPFVAFWVAVWHYPGISVGMYSAARTGSPEETFTYVDYTKGGLIAETTGQWSLTPSDTTPPVIEGMPASNVVLWPPNNQLVPVTVVTASDPDSGLASFEVTGSSSEPSGNNLDIVILGSGLEPRTVYLRAKRSGAALGLTYTVTATATDTAGNVTTSTATFTVPHDLRPVRPSSLYGRSGEQNSGRRGPVSRAAEGIMKRRAK